jgi:hypothetical protein
MFEIFGDEIVFDGQVVGCLTIRPGSLRYRVERALTDADADAAYDRGYDDGYDAGFGVSKEVREGCREPEKKLTSGKGDADARPA